MNIIFLYLCNILIVGLFLYSKLLPYKDKLHGQYKSIFGIFDGFFSPIFNFLQKYIKPFQVGQGLFVDLTQILLLLLLLVVLNRF